MARHELTTAEGRALQRVRDLTDLLWHIGIFVAVNGFLWIQDAVAGGGIDYAYWTTIPWGFGLLIHIVAFFVRRRQMATRKYQQYLDEEQRRELQHQ
jgi:hypothetical protein